MNFREIQKCRICDNKDLIPIINLGDQMLTGVFPRSKQQRAVTIGPLTLVKCFGEHSCGLVQLKHSYNLLEMYGDNYGYRSGLNQSMVNHLTSKVKRILNSTNLKSGDLIIDIGSNDGTTLNAYPKGDFLLTGVDPTAEKFRNFYPKNAKILPEFYSATLIEKNFPGKKAKIITSFSMFYDLEDPLKFMQEIFNVLSDDAVWVFEQSYLPEMLRTNSFDTICHEHLEYYALKQIHYMTKKIGFHITDVEFNDINGGSFSVSVRKSKKNDKTISLVDNILSQEQRLGLDTMIPFAEFVSRVENLKKEFLKLLAKIKDEGKTILALGASTKGNVLLQYYGINSKNIEFIGEVNEDKFNCYTPGSWIQIIEENKLLDMNPDFIVILPWHFKDFFVKNKKIGNKKLVFPLPDLNIV